MKQKNEVIMCMAVRPGYRTAVESYQTVCEECGAAVWKALSSPAAAYTICVECGIKLMMAEGDNIEVVPPTPRQMKDILTRVKRS